MTENTNKNTFYVEYDMSFPDDVKKSLKIVNKRLRKTILALTLRAKEKIKKNHKKGDDYYFNILNSKLDHILKYYKHSNTSFLFRHLELLLSYYGISFTDTKEESD